ncbi:protein homooligomerization [Mactra antiquata]
MKEVQSTITINPELEQANKNHNGIEKPATLFTATPYSPDKNVCDPGTFWDILDINEEEMTGVIFPVSIDPSLEMIKSWQTNSVGGKIFQTTDKTLFNDKSSIFQLMIVKAKLHDHKLFVDRDPTFFNYILNYLRCDLNLPANRLPQDRVALYSLKEEAKFCFSRTCWNYQ